MARESAQRKTIDMKDAMDVYQEMGTPGAAHKLLARMAGNWNVKSSCVMEAGGQAIESTGSSVQKMVLGGRFLQQEYSGDMMGTPFTGIGFSGYDNHTEKYVSTWMDSMGTCIYFFEGTAGADGKTITQTGNVDDPVRGHITWRSVTSFVDDNCFKFVMYSTDGSGKEEKMAEMNYTRK
jgi:Protein of unknown function (DUF1579)